MRNKRESQEKQKGCTCTRIRIRKYFLAGKEKQTVVPSQPNVALLPPLWHPHSPRAPPGRATWHSKHLPIDRILTEAISLFGRRASPRRLCMLLAPWQTCCRRRRQRRQRRRRRRRVQRLTQQKAAAIVWGEPNRVSVRAKTFDCNSINKRDH